MDVERFDNQGALASQLLREIVKRRASHNDFMQVGILDHWRLVHLVDQQGNLLFAGRCRDGSRSLTSEES